MKYIFNAKSFSLLHESSIRHCFIFPDTSNLKQYLGVTYDQWKSGAKPVYLATVKDLGVKSRSAVSSLLIHIGNSSQWMGYINGPLDANRNYK